MLHYHFGEGVQPKVDPATGRYIGVKFVGQVDRASGAVDGVCVECYIAGLPALFRAIAGRIFGGAVRAGAQAAEGEVTVYRVFGEDARAEGFSWTPKNPRTVSNFRDEAGLPSGPSGATNSADFLVTGRANTADVIKSRSALPLDGNKGGLPEYIIDPKNVRITDFSVLKP